MTKPLMKTTISLIAVLALLSAPAAFAGHGRHGGWHHGGHGGHYARYYGGHRYHGGYYVRDHDGFGRWVAGALVVGALTNLVVDATQPRVIYREAPPVRTRVIYRDAPRTRVYEDDRGYNDPYQTRYIGHEDDNDDD